MKSGGLQGSPRAPRGVTQAGRTWAVVRPLRTDAIAFFTPTTACQGPSSASPPSEGQGKIRTLTGWGEAGPQGSAHFHPRDAPVGHCWASPSSCPLAPLPPSPFLSSNQQSALTATFNRLAMGPTIFPKGTCISEKENLAAGAHRPLVCSLAGGSSSREQGFGVSRPVGGPAPPPAVFAAGAQRFPSCLHPPPGLRGELGESRTPRPGCPGPADD